MAVKLQLSGAHLSAHTIRTSGWNHVEDSSIDGVLLSLFDLRWQKMLHIC